MSVKLQRVLLLQRSLWGYFHNIQGVRVSIRNTSNASSGDRSEQKIPPEQYPLMESFTGFYKIMYKNG